MRTYLTKAAVNYCSWMVKVTCITPRAGSSTKCSCPREQNTLGPTFAGRSSTRLGSFLGALNLKRQRAQQKSSSKSQIILALRICSQANSFHKMGPFSNFRHRHDSKSPASTRRRSTYRRGKRKSKSYKRRVLSYKCELNKPYINFTSILHYFNFYINK